MLVIIETKNTHIKIPKDKICNLLKCLYLSYIRKKADIKNHDFIHSNKNVQIGEIYKNQIDYKTLNSFLEKNSKKKFLIFGFTSLVYENLIQKLSVNLIKSDFQNGILIHGGGWKKMEKLKVNNSIFKKKLINKINLKKVYNYYGLVEQTGSVFIESQKCGYLHTSVYSDIFIRDKKFNVLKNKEKGLIQLISLLPTSYPGHNILTEDIGEIIGEDNCKCGLKGKYFLVHGRAKEAEICEARKPATKPPRGIPPRKARKKILITLPRISSVVFS